MIASSHESEFTIEMQTRFVEVLHGGGFTQVSVRHDGRYVVLEGYVPSFDGKAGAIQLLRPLVSQPIINCIRVHPV